MYRRALALGRAVLAEARAERLTFMAGSIAYHAFVSLLPFMLVVLLLVSTVEDQATAVEVLTAMGTYLSPNANQLVTQTVREATEQTSLSLLGLGVLLWGAIKIFRSLDEAFSSIYDVTTQKGLVDSFTDAIVALLAVGVGLGVAALIGTVVSFDGGPVGGPLNRIVSTASLAVVFLPLFYLFPDEDVTVREVLPGTALAAVGWTLLEFLFRYYVAVASVGERYGVFGTIILLVTWLYFSGFVLLLGAALNAVLSGRSADVSESGWGVNEEARAAAPFTEPLERIDAGLDDGEPLSAALDDVAADLPTPDEHEVRIAAPDRPEALGGDEVEGNLHLRWVYGRDVEGKSEEREVPTADSD
ncbi:YihY/virulence factor BrkB family protein [Halomicrobium urmianum]|uniref:YihY/virulence factor BrkB family protein n=1 Tax=Halomicrobium urmianum TaxID=1586233 RepID=UPI001CDA4A9D|nr:YihY/virulence factor BrkB family protein [Halomicrobium urmianum]